MPLEMATISAPASEPKKARSRPLLSRGSAVGSRDRMAFTEQLALLLGTGTPLHAALKSLQAQADNAALERVIEQLIGDVTGGQRFSEALAKHPKVFSTTYVNLIAASEGGGFMHEVLTQLLAEEERRDELRNKLVSALTYPAFLSAFSMLVVVFVLVVVFPKFSSMFAKIEDQLPATTIGLMWLSDVLRVYWWELLAALGGAGFLAHRWLASDKGSAAIDRLKLSVPLIKDIFVQLYLTQCLKVMSLSLTHGVSIVDTLESCRDVISNRTFRSMLTRVERAVQEGQTVSSGFADSKFLPDLAKQMIATADESGSLAPVLGRVADHYERLLERKLLAFGKMVEPVMLLVMGVLVGVIVSSLILPIFKLSKAVT